MSQSGSYFTNGMPIGAVAFLTGNSGGPVGPDGANNINVLGAGLVDVAGNPGTNTLTITVSGTLSEDFVTDNGTATPVANVLNVLGGATSPETVVNINTFADPNGSNNLRIALNNTIFWPRTNAAGTTGVIYLDGSRFMHNYGLGVGQNTFLGFEAGNFTNTQNDNVGIGAFALTFLTSGARNVGVGWNSLSGLRSGMFNTALGSDSMIGLSTGSNNIGIGFQVLPSSDSTLNIAIGNGAGSIYTIETNNLIIGHNIAGVPGEDNTIRIGNNHTRTFIDGIYNVNPTINDAMPVFISSGDQLGTIGAMTNGQLIIGSTFADPVLATLTAGSGITISNGPGSITISATGADILAYTAVSSSPYVVLSTDEYLGVNVSIIPITIQLPNTTTTGRVFYIKDSTGNANTNNISVTTVGGVVTIDGVTTYTMNTQYSAISVIFNGTSYEIF